MSGFETESWSYFPAKYQRPGNNREILWIVVHCEQSPEVRGSARSIALYFQNPPRAGSSHVTVDPDEVIQCVYDSNIAAGAVGANTNGLHLEMPGYAEQTAEQWMDDYSKGSMEKAADVISQWCLKYDIPVHWLTDDQYFAQEKGIITHAQVTRVAKAHGLPQTGHSDPGPNFNQEYFIGRVQFYYDKHKAEYEAGHVG